MNEKFPLYYDGFVQYGSVYDFCFHNANGSIQFTLHKPEALNVIKQLESLRPKQATNTMISSDGICLRNHPAH